MMRNLMPMLICCLLLFAGCDEDDIVPAETTQQSSDSAASSDDPATINPYFPPLSGDTWHAVSPATIGWKTDSLQTLLKFLESKNTYGFIVLYKGHLVVEQYWNNWDLRTRYPVASAAKSITALLVGIAQDDGLVDIDKSTSDYLGDGWTSFPGQKEKQIRLHHHLSMTTGLDEADDQCTSPSCLKYKTDPGQRWAYHNSPYNLLHRVIENASGKSIHEFTRTALATKIGMQNWTWADHTIELSTRDMARFGLLLENGAVWEGVPVLKDKQYLSDMLGSSNPFNKSYGYLWWLNGKSSYMVPGESETWNGKLVPSAPSDMIAAMGKGDIKIYVAPGLDVVVVRHGADTGTATFGPSSFDEAFWSRLMRVIVPAAN